MNEIKPSEDQAAPTQAAENAAGRFWSKPSTQSALRELDIFMSVWKARRCGMAEIPTADSIFEKPVPNLPPFRLAEGGVLHVDWETYRCDRTRKLTSPEELVALGVERMLRTEGIWHYAATLRLYFPRSGLFSVQLNPAAKQQPIEVVREAATLLFVPGDMRRGDQWVICDALRALIADKHRVVEPPDPKPRREPTESQRARARQVEAGRDIAEALSSTRKTGGFK